MSGKLGVAVVGCGAIGARRARIAAADPDARLLAVVDAVPERAAGLAGELGCDAGADWRAAVGRDEIDLVIVSTTHDALAEVSITAIDAGKDVLVEKPMARNLGEARGVVAALEAAAAGAGEGKGPIVGVGFNHRHHPAVAEAHRLLAGGAIGEPYWARCRYGHGGRPGYGDEWRLDPKRSGGGELLDQGMHAVDLFRWFLGEFAEALAMTATFEWMPSGVERAEGGSTGAVPPVAVARASVGAPPSAAARPSPPELAEDNAFVLFRSAKGRIASLHASWTQWHNLFCFEVYGSDGFVTVDGLGGSYGTERLTVGRRARRGGPPSERVAEYPGDDLSWQREWDELVAAIRERRPPLASHRDGLRAMHMVGAAYEAARSGACARVGGERSS